MEQKINIAKLLKGCPSGMELDCMMYENLYFDSLNADYDGTISCYTLIDGIKSSINFSKYGTFNNHKGAKCVLFPKGKTTWEGFVPLIQFKDGDVVVSSLGSIHILKNRTTSYIYVNSKGCLCKSLTTCVNAIRLATEEEKAKLFQTIKDNGYKWNEETKTLEKLIKPQFKIRDRMRNNQVDLGNIYTIIEVRESSYVVNKNNEHNNYNIDFVLQDEWELIPNKFDITTLKPFESKVLVRANNGKWVAAFFSHYDKDVSLHYCVVGGLWYDQCISYDGNEHLLNTTDNCDDYYKDWED